MRPDLQDQQDTIVAPATPPGRGGIAIVRVSGPRAREALDTVFAPASGQALQPRMLTYGHMHDARGEHIDECMAVFLPAPRTYTREDVAELHLHGSEGTVRRALDALIALNLRPAEPGEFTRRAFLNGRIDLSQAEAVMQLISAGSDRAGRAALRQLEGGTAGFVREAQERMVAILAGVEAALDYPEEIDEDEAAGDTADRCVSLACALEQACSERAVHLLDSGLETVIAGRPNAGKSSLLNALLHEERAIVTDIPGTTRDIVRGTLQLEGVAVHLSDTAGLRENTDAVETIGVERALRALRQADLALVVLDTSVEKTGEDEQLLQQTAAVPRILVGSKKDLGVRWSAPGMISLSVKTGEGMDALLEALRREVLLPREIPLTNQRQLRLARQAASALRDCAQALRGGVPLDLAAVELHRAADCLAEITGDRIDEKTLDAIFSTFCVGK